MVNIISREEWGATQVDGNGSRQPSNLVRVLHHSAGPTPSTGNSLSADIAVVQNLEVIGQNRFERGISYTFIVTPAGRVFEGHSIGRVGTHTLGQNSTGAGICIPGDYTSQDISTAAENALIELLQEGVDRGWWTSSSISGGHRDYVAGECPGDILYSRIDEINARAQGGSPDPGDPDDDNGGGVTPGPFTGFIRATADGDLRVGPSSSSSFVRTVLEGQIMLAAEGEAEWWTRVGDYWFPNRRVQSSGGVVARGLLHGQWPDRDMRVVGEIGTEADFAWRELLAQVGFNTGNAYLDRHAWLGSRGYSGAHTQRLQQFLRDRIDPNDGLPFYRNAAGTGPGEVDNSRGPRTNQGEIRFLNWQREFFDNVEYYSHYSS
ncbi:peptidoglycan recognition protein family protein [Nesterenkonia sandarakina]|uniref:Peptidoglycan recognition protein family domain-containing protein n=1 Tax=Nesterenkonia sandarakina TaxID=272918 RepID=A0A7Z0EBH7_9MICC|nr:peptidoglycan recognition family protein [Nesterenkonia sandarakina]NYJ18145.1 hypothetical protein [Nesterenkonia sandarakina]